MEKYFGTFEAAKICRVTPASIIRWIKEGKLKASVTIGGHHRIAAMDLLCLVRSLQIEPSQFFASEGCHRVLIVDDETGIRKVFRATLEVEISGIQIEEAGDGFEAGLMIQRFKPHLIILDLMLPGLDGYKVAKFIRANGALPKIIAVSGYADTQTEILKCGADDFMLKPINAAELSEKVRGHLRKINAATLDLAS